MIPTTIDNCPDYSTLRAALGAGSRLLSRIERGTSLAPPVGMEHGLEAELAACTVWFDLLVHRIEQIKASFPGTLTGTVQLAIRTRAGSTQLFVLALDGPRTRAARGLANAPTTWLELEVASVEQFLAEGKAPAGSIRAYGNIDLINQLVEVLEQPEPPKSWVGIRSIE